MMNTDQPTSDHLDAAREFAEILDQPEMSDLDALIGWAYNLVDDHHAGGEHLATLTQIADDIESADPAEAAHLREIVADYEANGR